MVSVFWFWREIGFGVTYVHRVQCSCGIVLALWFWWEVVFGVTYVLRVVIGHGIMAGNIARLLLQFAKSPIADVRFDLKSKPDLRISRDSRSR